MDTTFVPDPKKIDRKWYVVDARGKTLGRLASQVAAVLRGKHKPIFTPNVDTGDFVIVINARDVVLTGKKRDTKVYYRHSLYPGGLKSTTARKMLAEKPELVIEKAVWGMLPHNRLGRAMFRKLKVYPGNEHPHAAQKPETLNLEA